MQWADHLDIQSGSLFQKILNLYAVFANDVDKIASCFVFPWLVCIQGTEFTETVSGEQDLFGLLISNHNFRPVNKRSHKELKRVSTEIYRIAFAYNHLAVIA